MTQQTCLHQSGWWTVSGGWVDEVWTTLENEMRWDDGVDSFWWRGLLCWEIYCEERWWNRFPGKLLCPRSTSNPMYTYNQKDIQMSPIHSVFSQRKSIPQVIRKTAPFSNRTNSTVKRMWLWSHNLFLLQIFFHKVWIIVALIVENLKMRPGKMVLLIIKNVIFFMVPCLIAVIRRFWQSTVDTFNSNQWNYFILSWFI